MGDVEDKTGTIKKYMFDTNFFDDTQIEEETEDLPPPPPTFSEEELEAAKKQAFNEGKQAGIQETQASLQQQTTNTVSSIARDMQTLFNAEQERAKLYEMEAVRLTLHVFKKLFPYQDKAHGFEELQSFLLNTLNNKREQSTIEVHVASALAQDVLKALDLISQTNSNLSYEVLPSDQIQGFECRLNWKDGGAIYKPQDIAQEVEELLKQVLAQEGFTPHDDEDMPTEADTHIEADQNIAQDQTDEQKHDIVDNNHPSPTEEDASDCAQEQDEMKEEKSDE